MKILITTGSWSAPLVIMESLAKQGHDIYLLDNDPYCAGFHSKYCKQGIVSPNESKGSVYVDAIENIVRSEPFDLLIPAGDLSTEFLSAQREKILPHVKMLLPSKELIELARFKDRTYQFALANGIKIPKTHFPQLLDDVKRLIPGLTFPCVVKKPRGTANKGNAYLNNAEELLSYYEFLSPEDGWPVIQEFIKGDFYGILAIADQGEILDCVMFKSHQKYSLSGTAAYCCSVVDEKFLNTAQKFIKLLNWTGAINIDFLKDRDGDFKLLEINPRLSGTLGFACQLGVDLPVIYLALARGQTVKKFEGVRYRPDVMFRFVLPAEIIFAFNQKRYLWQLFANFFNFNMKTDIPWNDFRLLVWKLRHLRWYWQGKTKESKGMNEKFS